MSDLLSIELRPLGDPGACLRFDAIGTHNRNAIGGLVERAVIHSESPDGNAGFIHPVVRPFANRRLWGRRGRVLYFIGFAICDWQHKGDGRLLSGMNRRAEP